MRRKWIFLAPLAMLLFIAIGGEVVLQLWNWLLPPLFGWRQITFGKPLEFWRCAGSSSADLDATVPIAPVSAVAWPSAGNA